MSKELLEIFKAYDIRGKVGTELNEDVLFRLGKSFADWLPEDGAVAVGHDMRPDSRAFAEALMKGLVAQGRNVKDIGMVATDMIYYAVGAHGLAGGAVVTASHNPGEYNGIKLCREDAKPIGENSGLFEIRDAIINDIYKTNTDLGSIEKIDVIEGWLKHVLSFIDTEKLTSLNIAVDAGNGVAGTVFAELEPYVPWVVTEMYFEPDGTFPNHEANPLKFETLKDITNEIVTNNLNGGIAFDGDGDRAMLIDETGEILTGGVISALLAEYFLKKYPGSTIVYDARNSKSVPEVIEKNGGRPLRTKVGHSNIKQSMRDYDSPFGGEASGHFYFRDNWYADSGLLAAVVALYVATINKQKLSEIRKKYTHYAAIPELNFEVRDKDIILDKIKDAFSEFGIDELDGITVTLDNSWFNVRTSNTEPLLRLNAEADDEQSLDSIVAKVTKIISS